MTIKPEWIAKLKKSFDPDLTTDIDMISVPDHWHTYTSADQTARLSSLHDELKKIAPYFPETVAGLKRTAIDAFLVTSKMWGLCRIIAQHVEDGTYYLVSRVPTKVAAGYRADGWAVYDQNAHEILKWIHRNVMDGLTDIYGFGGFKSSGGIRSMKALDDGYAELDWYAEFDARHDTSKIVEIFSSGGGGYLLINVEEDGTKNPKPMAYKVDVKTSGDDAFKEVELFPYLDAWMSIAIADG